MTHNGNVDMNVERDLRAMLAARDPGASSAALAVRIRNERAAQLKESRRLPLRLAGIGTAIGAIAALVLVLAGLATRSSVTNPGSMPSSVPVVGPAAVPIGAGVTAPAGAPILHILALAIVILALGFVSWRTPRKGIAVATALAAVAVGFGVVIFILAQPVGRRAGASGASPVAVSADGQSLVVLGAGDFWVETTLTNVSSLSLVIQGLEMRGAAGDVNAMAGITPPGFVGIGLIDGSFGPEGAIPFHTVELAPDASVDVILHGVAGACALPSIPPDGGSTVTFTSVELQIEQLGVTRTVSMPLDQPIGIYQRPGCP
jgi:hypothetical protein